MFSAEIVGAWIAVFLTLAIFSYLYRDNPFYKIAEHVFVGVSAGYWASMIKVVQCGLGRCTTIVFPRSMCCWTR